MSLALIPKPTAAMLADGPRQSPLDRVIRPGPSPHLGFGVARPFRRDEKNDFANLGGVDLVKACVAQVLLTRSSNPNNPALQGEIDWAPERGSLLYLLKHKKNVLVEHNLAKIYVADALRRWEPRVIVRSIAVSESQTNPNVMLIRLFYDVISTNRSSNRVLYPGVEQTVAFDRAA